MYYTPGWGSVATATVAVVAIVVTSVYNSRTLRAAASRFEFEKSERLMDKRRESIVDVLHHVGRLKAVWNAIGVANLKALATEGTDDSLQEKFEQFITKDAMDVVADLDRALIAAELLAQTGAVGGGPGTEHYVHALRADLLQVAEFFQQLPSTFPIDDRLLAERRRLYVEVLMAKNAEALRVAALERYQRIA
jgi:hypothetical protein